jgi:glutaredoxin
VSDPQADGRVEVVLYGAPDCSLCDKAKAVLEPAAVRLGFRLVMVDITGDPALEAKHRESLPVVEIDGEQVFVYHVSQFQLERRVLVAQSRRLSQAS